MLPDTEKQRDKKMTIDHLSENLALPDSAKWAFTTRRVDQRDAVRVSRAVHLADSGDLVLAQVDAIGSHGKLQLACGRPSELYPGDLVIAACGARYASDQFEGVAEIGREGADLLAGGGVIGTFRKRHAAMKMPTRLRPLGLLLDQDEKVINLARYAMTTSGEGRPPVVIGVVGSSMNAGKTTAVASLVHGLHRAGWRVAGIKATGTGAYGDFNAYKDAGAQTVLDFTDAGLVSTYLQPLPRLKEVLCNLLSVAAAAQAEVAVVEFADGVLQSETAGLLAMPDVRSLFSGFLYAAQDSLSALGGCVALARLDIVPIALTGLIARSPLSLSEAEQATGQVVMSREALRDPAQAGVLMNVMRQPFRVARVA